MTTEELVTKLKNNDVSADLAGAFHFMHLKVDRYTIGTTFCVPVVTEVEGKLLKITAKFTGPDKDYIPEWVSLEVVNPQ
jgi:hypothetical protein